jgi:hypothetical protein
MPAHKPDSLGRTFARPKDGSIHRTKANAAREPRVSTRAETTRKVFGTPVRARGGRPPSPIPMGEGRGEGGFALLVRPSEPRQGRQIIAPRFNAGFRRASSLYSKPREGRQRPMRRRL